MRQSNCSIASCRAIVSDQIASSPGFSPVPIQLHVYIRQVYISHLRAPTLDTCLFVTRAMWKHRLLPVWFGTMKIWESFRCCIAMWGEWKSAVISRKCNHRFINIITKDAFTFAEPIRVFPETHREQRRILFSLAYYPGTYSAHSFIHCWGSKQSLLHIHSVRHPREKRIERRELVFISTLFITVGHGRNVWSLHRSRPDLRLAQFAARCSEGTLLG